MTYRIIKKLQPHERQYKTKCWRLIHPDGEHVDYRTLREARSAEIIPPFFNMNYFSKVGDSDEETT